jgi:hypothetical protein
MTSIGSGRSSRNANWLAPAGTAPLVSPIWLTAVLAGQHRLTIIHHDADFEIAAEVLHFDHRWVASRGSL